MRQKTPKESTPKARIQRKASPSPPASTVTSAQIEPSHTDGVFHDEGLLETARTKWQYAEWQDLISLPAATVAQDPDRAKLSLLIAAAHSHAGDMAQAKRFAQQALSWGCGRELAARVLLSAIHNSLGRVAASLEDDEAGTAHFEDAIRLVEPRADAALLGRTRRIRETARLGLLSDAAGFLEKELGLVQREALSDPKRLAWLERQMKVLRNEMNNGRRGPGARGTHPLTVIVAGVPRSGSTWVFNIVRLLLEHAGKAPYGAWVDDYKPEEHPDAPALLIKVHNPEQLSFPYDRIITTKRDTVERLASLIRMGWVGKEPEVIRMAYDGHRKLYEFWNQMTDLEVDFGQITSQPKKAIQNIAGLIGVDCNPRIAGKIERQMKKLETPDRGDKPDPLTLLHPGHRGDPAETAEIIAWVREALAVDDLNLDESDRQKS